MSRIIGQQEKTYGWFRREQILDELTEGIRLFNDRKFFEAHEALEAVWLKASGDRKIFLHGLIQVAAAFHHYQRQNRAGFRSLLEKGWKKLEGFGNEEAGLDLRALREEIRRWRDYLRRAPAPCGAGTPPLPRLSRLRTTDK